MIPLSDDNPTRKKPYVVYMLVILNVIVYFMNNVGAPGLGRLWNFSMVPYSVIHDVRVIPLINQLGQIAGFQKDFAVGPHPQWITIFTSMFMHGGFMHIAMNMLYLWIFGNNVEDALGHIKFLLFYIACGVLASVAHIASDANSMIPTVGASGAIAGVLGAYLLLYPHARVRTLIFLGWFVDYAEIPAIYVLGVWFLLQLTGVVGSAGSVGGGVAYWAHIGGFIAGLIVIYIIGGRRLAQRSRSRLEPYDDV